MVLAAPHGTRQMGEVLADKVPAGSVRATDGCYPERVTRRLSIVALGLLTGFASVSLLAAGAANSEEREAETVSLANDSPAALLEMVPGFPHADGATCLHLAQPEVTEDRRTREVHTFLSRHSCPISGLAAEFVLAADLNQLDYRLLPTLAVLESGCGRATRNHNLFGWANGRKPFASFEQAIHHVAQRLRLAPHYAGKSTIEKLRKYNRRAAYRVKVLRLMDTMDRPTGMAEVAAK